MISLRRIMNASGCCNHKTSSCRKYLDINAILLCTGLFLARSKWGPIPLVHVIGRLSILEGGSEWVSSAASKPSLHWCHRWGWLASASIACCLTGWLCRAKREVAFGFENAYCVWLVQWHYSKIAAVIKTIPLGLRDEENSSRMPVLMALIEWVGRSATTINYY